MHLKLVFRLRWSKEQFAYLLRLNHHGVLFIVPEKKHHGHTWSYTGTSSNNVWSRWRGAVQDDLTSTLHAPRPRSPATTVYIIMQPETLRKYIKVHGNMRITNTDHADALSMIISNTIFFGSSSGSPPATPVNHSTKTLCKFIEVNRNMIRQCISSLFSA